MGPRHEKVFEKDLLPKRSGKGRFAACSGRNSTGIFFSLHVYSSIQIVKKKKNCVSTSELNTTRPTKRNDVEAGNNYKREGKQEARATERGGNKSKDHEKTKSKARTNRKIPPSTSAQFFRFWKRPGRRLLPYFCSEKRPGYVANAPGALFQNRFMVRPGGRSLRSLR